MTYNKDTYMFYMIYIYKLDQGWHTMKKSAQLYVSVAEKIQKSVAEKIQKWVIRSISLYIYIYIHIYIYILHV